jgi:long-chain fatty acid transport protein
MVAQMKYDVAAGAGQAVHDNATSFGIGATVGLMYKPTKAVTFGAAYESRSTFQDFVFNVPARANPFAPGTTIPGGTDKLAFDQPQSVTVGVAVTPIDMLLLAADVQWINWASTMGRGLPRYTTDPNATGALPFDMGWSDQWVLKVGTQVTPLPRLTVRAGYNYGKSPLDPNRAFENLSFPAVAEHHVTAGFGYELTRKVTLNVTGVYAFNARLQGSNAAPPPPMGGTGQGIAAYSTEMSQFAIDFGVAHRF